MEKQKYTWRKEYSVVLIMNAIYILLFYLLMTSFS